MSNLKSYVEKYLLNPAIKIGDIEDDGNKGNDATITPIEDYQVDSQNDARSFSKIRALNNLELIQNEPKYKGKKISRTKLKESKNTTKYDPELSKYFLTCEDSDDESEVKQKKKNVSKSKVKSKTKHKKDKTEIQSSEEDDLFMHLAEETIEHSDEVLTEAFENSDDDKGSDDEEEIFEESDEDNNEPQEDTESSGEEFIEDENVAEGSSDEFERSDSCSDDDLQEPKRARASKSEVGIKTFNKDNAHHMSKCIAVKNQQSVYDMLFEMRINMQKMLSIANQLPQHDCFRNFIQAAEQEYQPYNDNLAKARKSVKKLLIFLMSIQDLLLSKNLETKHILEEIGSSGPSEEGADGESGGKKRRIEQLGESLRKRHKAILPYRDQTLTKWYEKSKLLSGRARDKFSSFDVPPSQQIANLLANKEQLIKKTQMIGMSRGNVCKILGKTESDSPADEEYDPEIFDDTDFYSRLLEELLRSKVTNPSDNLAEVSRRWVNIQRLRKKAKKTVNDRASKDRKIKYEVMRKLEQYMAPSKPSLMEDDATNRLFSSLFGQTLKLNEPNG